MNKAIVTGSSGLIGSEVCTYFCKLGWKLFGIDNNQRAVFFGAQGDTRWNQHRLIESLPTFTHCESDTRDRRAMLEIMEDIRPDLVINAAAQPSHDLAAKIPFEDFDINAVAALNMLEATRCFAPAAPFVHLSTNKVYGDAPNEIEMVELPTRWDYAYRTFAMGIDERFRIDQSKHSLFAALKLAADVMLQEYGHYFGLATCCVRGGYVAD